MKIHVTNIQTADGIEYVTFSSPAGKGKARWATCSGHPELQEYCVELDIQVSIHPSHSVLPPSRESDRISLNADSTTVHGLVEQVDEDGIAYLRLHESCIIMVECDSPYPTPGTTVRLSLASDELSVTPFGV